MIYLQPQQFNNKQEFLGRFIVPSKYLDNPIEIYYDLQEEKLVIIQERVTLVKYALFYYDDSALALPFFEKTEDVKGSKAQAGFVTLFGRQIKIYDLFGSIDIETIMNDINDAFESEPRSFITKFPIDELNASLYTHYIAYNGENNPSFRDILKELKENTVITVRHNLKGNFYALVLENDEIMSIPLVLINKKIIALLGVAGTMEDFMLGDFEKGITRENIVEFRKALDEFIKRVVINILAIELVSDVVKYVDENITEPDYLIRKATHEDLSFKLLSKLFGYSIEAALTPQEFDEIYNRIDKGEVVLLINKQTHNLQVFLKVKESIYTTPILPLARDMDGNIVDLHAILSNALSIRIALNGEFVNLQKFKKAFEEEVEKLPDDFDTIKYSSLDLSEFNRLDDAQYYGTTGVVVNQNIAEEITNQKVLLEVIPTEQVQVVYILKNNTLVEIPALVTNTGSVFAISNGSRLVEVGNITDGIRLELLQSMSLEMHQSNKQSAPISQPVSSNEDGSNV